MSSGERIGLMANRAVVRVQGAGCHGTMSGHRYSCQRIKIGAAEQSLSISIGWR